MKKISVVLPVYNEEKNIPVLTDKLLDVLQRINYEWEIIFVDDYSVDRSFEELKKSANKDERIKILRLGRNFGQTQAISAGIDRSSGDVIVLMDADLENDPQDIPKLLDKIKEGYDVVSGWRQDRWKGQYFTRRLPSQIANYLISKISGIDLHDFGCTLKAYKREVLKRFKLYGEMHRFIPALAAWYGYRVYEIPVRYEKRKYGKSKYSISRVFRVLLDILFLKFLFKFLHRPLHFFGGVGIISVVLGGVAGLFALYFKLSKIHHKDFVETPLPVIMTMLVLLGTVFTLMGILAELLIRIYFEGQDKKNYFVKEEINFKD